MLCISQSEANSKTCTIIQELFIFCNFLQLF